MSLPHGCCFPFTNIFLALEFMWTLCEAKAHMSLLHSCLGSISPSLNTLHFRWLVYRLCSLHVDELPKEGDCGALPFLEWPWELLRKFVFNEWECTHPGVHWCHQSSHYTAKPPAGGDISIKRIWKVAPEMHSSQNFLCIYSTLFWGPQKNFQLAQFFSP